MTIAIIVFSSLLFLVLASSIFFAARVVYPKVYPFEETRKIELEKNRYDENLYLSWTCKDFELTSPFGYKLSCSYFPLSDSHKTVVISHGISCSRYGSIKYMPLFRKHGFNILLYDLRNHGLSGGKNTTFGWFEKYDLQILVDWALKQLNSNGCVGTMGESLGAAITLQHAVIDKRISFAIADCPYSDLQTLLAYRLKAEYHLPPFPTLNLANIFCKLLASLDINKVSPIQDIKNLETPLFWIHGEDDHFIPPQMSLNMFEAKQAGLKKIYLAPNAAHVEALISNPQEYDAQITAFLEDLNLAHH